MPDFWNSFIQQIFVEVLLYTIIFLGSGDTAVNQTQWPHLRGVDNLIREIELISTL